MIWWRQAAGCVTWLSETRGASETLCCRSIRSIVLGVEPQKLPFRTTRDISVVFVCNRVMWTSRYTWVSSAECRRTLYQSYPKGIFLGLINNSYQGLQMFTMWVVFLVRNYTLWDTLWIISSSNIKSLTLIWIFIIMKSFSVSNVIFMDVQNCWHF